MDYVAEYAAKTKEAERLRKLQDMLQGMALAPSQGTIKTAPISGGGGGAPGYANVVYDQPGQEQADWGGAIGKLGAAYMGRRGEQGAADAEDAAQTARMEGLKAVLGEAAAGGRMSPEQMMRAEQLGVDPAMLKLMQPKDNTGSIVNAAGTAAGRAALVQTGLMTQEQADAMGSAADADTAAKDAAARSMAQFEAGLKPANQQTSEQAKIDLWRTDPDLAKQIYGDKTAAGGAGGGGTGSGRYDAEREKVTILSNAAELRDLINNPENNMFGAEQSISGTVTDWAGANPDSLIPGLIGTAASKLESPANARMRVMNIDSALESVAKLAPASDADIRLLRKKYPNYSTNRESALAMVDEMERIVQKYTPPTPVGAAGSPGGLGAQAGAAPVGQTMEYGGKQYRIVGGTADDPELEPM